MKKYGWLITFSLLLHGLQAVEKPCCSATPDAGPRVACGINMFLEADYILWTAREDGLAFVRSGINPGGNAAKGSVHHPNWQWSSGFKAGLGVNLPHDGWDVQGRYTFLHTRTAKKKITANPNVSKEYHPTWSPGSTLNLNSGLLLSLEEARSHWKLHFNVVDLELGRNFFVSHFLSLRPSFGLKGTWQDQDYQVRYTSAAGPLYRLNMDQDFWGVGLRLGLDSSYHLSKYWSFFGNIYFSALWGQFDVHRKDREKQSISAEDFVLLDRTNEFYTLKPVVEACIGFRFDHWFCRNRWHLRLEAGWEEQLWFSQNQFFHSFEESAHGDLSLQGLTLKARLDF